MSAIIFLLFFFISIAVIYLYSNQQRISENVFNRSFILSVMKKYGGTTLSHLLFLEDKQVFQAQGGSVLISYRKKGRRLFILGDPFGDKEKIEEGLNEFFSYASKRKLTPVFYQASEKYISFYEKHGYRLFKVGEEAKVNLKSFVIEGKKFGNIRNIKNKFTKDGYIFSVAHPPFSSSLLEEMKSVSNEWLNDRKEKGFSVSSFSEEYISYFPVSLFRDPNGRLIAFASLPSDYQKEETLSIDIMRYRNDSRGAMDMVFVSTILWAKEMGYTSCSLGMSPLSNVGVDNNSPFQEKIARYAFLNGCKFYNFKGLRRYKAKFATDWSPRYLVYKKSLLFLLILQLILIVQKEPIHKFSFIKKKIFRDKEAV
ncbi:phosphatidylglycerol lysyltransferase domain-containing protein [Bacillus sp. AFS040349]|uniref:phosphatidylglycerol lysyltransferase domain-containing protein n=1 Tax=Bacillus sp. AFS040349 TaxID=2033502 RepID=UPI0011457491|nr:phosphatidylglycerol lysyltransferase domain-containing protein [Bacillus sp. AFS040349]